MRHFKLPFSRRRRHAPPEPDSPFATPPPSRTHRRLRLPTLVGNMSFPGRRHSISQYPPPQLATVQRLQGEVSVPSVPTVDIHNSALSLPQVSAASEPPAAPAPIFYDMYDAPPVLDDSDTITASEPRESDRMGANSTYPGKDEGEHHMEELDAVNFDKASAANRFAHPRRRDIVTERHVPASVQQHVRPGRKRLASPQPLAPKRQPLEKSRIADYRVNSTNTDSSDDSRYRDQDRDYEIEHDHLDDEHSFSDSDFGSRSLTDGRKKSESSRNDSNTEYPQASRIRYSKPASRARRHRRGSSRPTSQLHNIIKESPFSLLSRESSTSSSAAEARSYNVYTDTLQNEARGDGGGLRTIVELLRDSEGNPIVIEKAALVIGILSENDSATRDAFGQFAAVQTLIQCLSVRISAKFDRSLIVKNVTFALACLLRDSPRNLRLFEMFDGPYKMGKAAASERYENKPDVPKYAMRALAELKYHPHSLESQTTQVLTNSSTTGRTLMYVLRAMTLHEYRTEIQECGLDALRTLLLRSGRGAVETRLLQQSANAAATAFKLHKESAEVNWQCLTLLCDLERLQGEAFIVDLDVECMFGAVGKVMEEAQKNEDTKGRVYQALVELLKRVLDMVERLACRRKEFTEQSVEAGAVETILKALDFFGGNRVEVDRIQSILRAMLDCDEGRFRMGSVKAACAILEGIEIGNRSAATVLS